MNPHRITLASLLFGFLLFFANPVSASVRCEIPYGGRQVCVTTGQLQVNKQVFCDKLLVGNSDKQVCKDSPDGFIDNMGENFHRYSPNEEIRFRISVKNVGDANFSKVTVTDIPAGDFLVPVTGSLTFDLSDLKPGETRSQEIKMRVLDTNRLPQNNTVCVVNAAEASAEGNTDRDTSQVCLERKVLGIEKGGQITMLPSTGVEDLLLGLGSISGLLAGAKLTSFGKWGFKKTYHQIVEGRFNKKEGGEN